LAKIGNHGGVRVVGGDDKLFDAIKQPARLVPLEVGMKLLSKQKQETLAQYLAAFLSQQGN
jgi:hypothetical protein